MILRLFYEKNLKLKIRDTFDYVFYNRIFRAIAFYQFFKQRLGFHELWLIFFRENILYKSTVSNLENTVFSH